MLHELELLSSTPAAGAFAVLLGLLWGSFANVVIYRWPPTDEHPRGRSVVTPGSHCSACQAPIAWYDNVPILSYLWLRGQCRACKAKFSPRYLLVEALTGLLFGVAWWFTLGTGGMFASFETRALGFVVDATFVLVMVVMTFIDIDHKLILNKLMWPAAALFYAFGLAQRRTWWEGLLGAAIGYGVPWLIGEVYYRLRGREGLGLGDGVLLAAIGALLGWRGVVVSLFGGSVIGSVIGIVALVSARRAETETETDPDAPSLMKTELPFGPFLAMAAVLYLFGEPWIVLHLRLYS